MMKIAVGILFHVQGDYSQCSTATKNSNTGTFICEAHLKLADKAKPTLRQKR